MSLVEEVINAADSPKIGIDTQLRAFRAVWSEAIRLVEKIQSGVAGMQANPDAFALIALDLYAKDAARFLSDIQEEMEKMQSEMQTYRNNLKGERIVH